MADNDANLWSPGGAIYVPVPGEPGPPGPPPGLVEGSTTQLPAGQPAKVTLVQVAENVYRFDFNIPAGTKGDRGDNGAVAALASTVVVTTLPAGTPATASIVGAPGSQVLHLGIPAGPKGDRGDQGFPGVSPDWLEGVGPPIPVIGDIGDYYINRTSGDWWGPKTDEGWGEIKGNLKGPPGDPPPPEELISEDSNNALVAGSDSKLFVPAGEVVEQDSDSITISGAGTTQSPKVWEVQVAPGASNLLESTSAGLKVTLPEDVVTDTKLDSRLTEAQREAIDLLNPATATVADVINALTAS